MTNIMDKMFDEAQELTDLKKRSKLFEDTLLKTINALESMNKAHEMGKIIHDNESLKKSLPEGQSSLLAVDYATQSLSWDNIKDVAAVYEDMRKMYKNIYKKDAVSSPSLVETKVTANLETQFIEIGYDIKKIEINSPTRDISNV